MNTNIVLVLLSLGVVTMAFGNAMTSKVYRRDAAIEAGKKSVKTGGELQPLSGSYAAAGKAQAILGAVLIVGGLGVLLFDRVG